MTKVALLDVNVLVALFDAEHVHHEVAHDWLADNRRFGWATCPLTENGFVRVVSNPVRRGELLSVAGTTQMLRRFCASGHHEFWPDDVSVRDEPLFVLSAARSHRHLTDMYLLAMAVKKRGRLVTFDQNVPVGAVKGVRRDSVVVLAVDDNLPSMPS